MFPDNRMTPASRASIVPYIADYMQRVAERHVSLMVIALLFSLEWGAVFFGGAPFSSLSATGRGDFLRSLEGLPSPRARSAMLGLKVLMSMAYFDDPSVQKLWGVHRNCGSAR